METRPQVAAVNEIVNKQRSTNTPANDESSLSAMAAARRPSVLLVDDDIHNLKAVTEILTDLDADLVCAQSGKEALRLILERDFAAILLDVRMPGIDGYETATLIRQRERSRRIPLIFLTAMDRDDTHIFRGYSAGAVDYVFKPVEPVILRAKVAAFIELRKQADEIRRAAKIERWLLEENTRIRAAKLDAEQQLRSSAARQELIIRSLPIVLYEADVSAGLARSYIEDSVSRLLGLDAATLHQDNTAWTKHVHPDDWAAVARAIERVHETGDYSVQYRWKGADGSYRYFLDQGVLVGGEDYDSPKVFGTMLDVHDQRTLEQQLAHAQKIEAIGQLTGGIAHDFGNMLTVVILNLDRVRRIGKLEGPIKRSVDLALDGAMHCRDMLKQLLSFARQQPLTPRAFNLNHLIHDLTDLLNRTLGERVEIKKELARELWQVSADPTQVEASIVNLVVNARDAMPNGGQVTVRTSNIDLVHDAVNGLTAGPYVLLEVADTGTGMTKDVMARALEPFFTTKEAGRGTGLGLSTTYGFVRQSGGQLILDSEPGAGTTVRIYLPRNMDEAPSAPVPEYQPPEARPVPRSKNKELVLAVEDDEQVRNTTSGLLRDLGYQVLEASDVPTALELLDKNEIVLLFTDLVMPGTMNGYQLAVEALKRKPGIRVLYTSAHAGDRILEIAGRALQPLLRKPYRDDELARAIRDALTVT
jgi:signal transduction histidine kinase